jgi:hypothetical protein
MLRATRSTILYRVPTDEDNDGWPLTEGRRRLRRRLRVGGDGEAETFSLRGRLPEEFATSETPQHKARRAAALEQALAEAYAGLEYVEAGEDEAGDGTITSEGEE